MKTELLIIKVNEEYIRFKDSSYILCNLDKASVFPMKDIELVKEHIQKAKKDGHGSAGIKKLILTEEDYNNENGA